MFSHTLKNQGFFLFLLAVLMLAASSAIAQDKVPQVGGANVSVTASATSDRVRFAAPSAVVQLRLEVYDGAGQKLIDTEQRGGNVLDWHLRGGSGERVADGTYLFVVTIKNLSGRLSQKLGSITVSAKSTTLRASAVTDLNAQQAQAVGPIESGEEGLSVLAAGDAQPVTVLAANDTEAQLARSRGALTFRFGDFFSGNDQEQMRLTEEGNLGIGTSEPKAKLDVAGTIRAERVLIVKPKLAGFDKTAAATNALAAEFGDSVQPLATGTGSQSRIAKWIDDGGTLGDSGITETAGGNIGIGTTTPRSLLQINRTVAGVSTLGDSRELILDTNQGGLNERVEIGLGYKQGATQQPVIIGQKVTSNVGTSKGDFYIATRDVTTDTAPTERLYIQANGNIGIGTTSPGSLLHINRTAVGVTTLGDSRALILDSNQGGANERVEIGLGYKQGATQQPVIIGQKVTSNIGNSKGDFYIATRDVTTDTAPTERLYIQAGGNVGIGTTVPTGRLDVVQSAPVSAINQTNAGLNVENSNSNGDAMISLTGGVAGGSGIISAMNTAQAPLPLRLYTGTAERMRVDTNGNVGIGTTGPNGRLNVVQSAPVSTISQSNAGLNVENSNANGDAMISLTGGVAGGSGIISAMNTAQAPLPLRLYTGIAERMRIDTNGNIGIGNSSPSQMLQLFKPGNTTNLISFGGDEWHVGNTNTSDFKIFRGPTAQLYLTAGGFVGIGTSTPSVKLDVAGDANVAGSVIAGNIAAKYQDIAEWVQARTPIAASTVVILDTSLANAVAPSARAYDDRVAGVVSPRPGVILGQSGAGKVLVATTGRVKVKVDATRHPIKIGDLLVTSDVLGVAMKSQPIRVRGVLIHRPGTIIGKALEPLRHGQGEILVLLSLQ